MLDNLYSSKLKSGELIIQYLNNKFDTNFNVRDFIWEQIDPSSIPDAKTSLLINTYKITHRSQELFPGEHIVELYSDSNDENSLVKIQPPILINNNPITKADCNIPYTEDYKTYLKNKNLQLEQTIGIIQQSNKNEPDLFNPNQMEIIVKDTEYSKQPLEDIAIPIPFALTPSLENETCITFRYTTKCMIRKPDEMVSYPSYFSINENLEFSLRLTKYFKDNWDEDWSGLNEGFDFEECDHLATYQEDTTYYHLMHFPPNGIRPSGLFFLVDKVSDLKEEYYPIHLTNGYGIKTITDKLFTLIKTNYLIKNFNYKPYLSEFTYDLYKNNRISSIFQKCLFYYFNKFGGLSSDNKELGIYFDVATQYWYLTKINNPELSSYNCTQIRFKIEGFDLSQLFKEDIVLTVNSINNLDIRTELFNKKKILLPSEKEGLAISYKQTNRDGINGYLYTFTASRGFASLLFKQNSKLTVFVKEQI